MIEKQTINGRKATVAYTDANGNPTDDLSSEHYARVLFDDNNETLLLHSPGSTSRETTSEHAAFAKRRVKQQMPVSQEPQSPRDLPRERARRATVWKQAIDIIDATEPQIREVVERGLVHTAGVERTRYKDAMAVATRVSKQVADIRYAAFIKAFRLIRDRGV
jgi:hypothetical protein